MCINIQSCLLNMCEKLKYCNRNIDSCLVEQIEIMQELGAKTISSCCGHDKYPPTIVIKRKDNSCYEHYSNTILKNYNPKFDKRHNSYYKKDKDGIYFIPELVN